MLNTRFTLCAIALLLAVTACGGGNKGQSTTSSTTRTSNTTAASPMASPAAGGGGGYVSAAAAPIPANLNCGAVSPVWANTRKHTYHLASDPLYGRTKRGQYMCPQTAAREGYHQAGSGSKGSMRGHHRRSGSMMQAQPSPSPESP